MDVYTIENPNANYLELLAGLRDKGLIEMEIHVIVRIRDADQKKGTDRVIDRSKPQYHRPDNLQFKCPKCGMNQRKSKHGDLCWRCQKKADAINQVHAPISITPSGNPPQAREHESNPLFAKTEGFRTQSDGVIRAKKLG